MFKEPDTGLNSELKIITKEILLLLIKPVVYPMKNDWVASSYGILISTVFVGLNVDACCSSKSPVVNYINITAVIAVFSAICYCLFLPCPPHSQPSYYFCCGNHAKTYYLGGNWMLESQTWLWKSQPNTLQRLNSQIIQCLVSIAGWFVRRNTFLWFQQTGSEVSSSRLSSS